jgi:tetratricopeptide (TPR) repeat protein
LQAGKFAEAIAAFDAIIAANPAGTPARFGRAIALEKTGRYAEAVEDLGKLLQANPSDPALLNNLADILATAPDDAVRNGQRAVDLATRAVAEMRKNPLRAREIAQTLDTLAAAYAEASDFEKAIATQRQAIELGTADEKQQLESRIKLYEAQKSYRRPGIGEKTSSRPAPI